MVRHSALALSVIFPIISALPANSPPELPHAAQEKRQDDTPQVDRAQAVVDTFRLSWEGYYKYAFPNDELYPVTNSFGNSRNGWGASAVDALSTALIMGEKDIVNQIISYIPTIDWANTSTSVSLFETTIRYLGGMLSGYDLLSGPLAHLADNPANVDALLTQSINLANNLSFAFETPTGIPYNVLNLSARSWVEEPNGLATVGTLLLEWTRLADLSGNETYAALVSKAESYLLSPSPTTSEPFPGLLGMSIDPQTGQFLDAYGGWIGGADSFYEYLLKAHMYDAARFEGAKARFLVAADSTIANLTSHPQSRPDLSFVASFNGTTLLLSSDHLACFDGGSFLLAGTSLSIPRYTAYGLALVASCHALYSSTATSIGPEAFSWDARAVPPDQVSFFDKNGFFVTDAAYNLRPEVLESIYYAYRVTRDQMYRDWAWDAFVAINATTRVGSGFSAIRDVDVEGGGGFTDLMESFWFAEVLKYCYLVLSDGEEEWQVGGEKDAWVFNTEAHPLRVFGR